MKRSILLAAAAGVASSLLLSHSARAAELYNNGTFVTGTSPGGNTISAVQTGYDTFGLVAGGYNSVAPQRVADDFIITTGGWDLDTLTIYAYEGGGLVNSFTAAYVAIFDCDPTGTEDLTPRYGSLDPFSAPNSLLSQTPLNIYRVSPAVPEGTSRHIHAVTLDLSFVPVLPPGQYWMAVGLQGSSSDATVAVIPVTPVPPNPDGLSWGRTRHAPPGREDFWQYADGSIGVGEDPNLLQPYDHAYKLDGNVVAVNQWSGGAGAYNNPANWSQGVVPNDNDAVANFMGGGGTVTLDSVVLLGKINFNSPGSYVLTGGATLNLSTLGDCTQLNVFNGNHTIATPVAVGDSVHMNVSPANSILTINSPLSGLGAVVKRGQGTAVVDAVRMDELHIRGGTLRIAPNGTSAATSNVKRFTIDVGITPRGKLDLTNNAFVVDYEPGSDSPMPQIKAWILSGFNGGSWNGNGIISAHANTSTHGIGYAEANALASTPAIFGTVDADAVLFRLTRYGDANLDGVVNLADFNRLAANFGASDANWHQGDFNYDGLVNLQDFNRLAGNFGLEAAPDGPTADDWFALASAVPEPAAPALLGMGLTLLLRRHRKA